MKGTHIALIVGGMAIIGLAVYTLTRQPTVVQQTGSQQNVDNTAHDWAVAIGGIGTAIGGIASLFGDDSDSSVTTS